MLSNKMLLLKWGSKRGRAAWPAPSDVVLRYGVETGSRPTPEDSPRPS
jgi:hypothetical protein